MVNNTTRRPIIQIEPRETAVNRISRIDPYRRLFPILEVDGVNFLVWRDNMKSLAELYDLEHTMPVAFGREPAEESYQLKKDRQLMNICLCTHVGNGLASLYRRSNDPDAIWKSLNDKFQASLNAEKEKTKLEWDELSVDRCSTLNEYEVKLHILADRMMQVGYESIVTESEKINKTIRTLGHANTTLAMQLRGEHHTSLDKLLYALREHNAQNQLMVQRAKQSREKDVITNFTTQKEEHGKNKSTTKGKPQRRSSIKKAKPTKGWTKNGKVLPCFGCGKTGHLARECRATPDEQKAYLFQYHIQRHKTGIESHGTEVQAAKAPVAVVGSVQSLFNVNATSVSEEMDLDEQEITSALSLEDQSCV
jgi:septum formation inhibitor MinC